MQAGSGKLLFIKVPGQLHQTQVADLQDYSEACKHPWRGAIDDTALELVEVRR